ncbi:LADA_0G10990g1_1 [Lachancea dasiensis]|uniref:LADA_0G10990g1_1 n=1 Tax=Lachancea dasiensis TaxID=1072105 RepID=A0A1G4JV09_9SACH|nr:LADA_0G10990g1_1 [Lachancea dasiensis]
MGRKPSRIDKNLTQKTKATKFEFPDAVLSLNSSLKRYEYLPVPECIMDDKVIIINKFLSDLVSQELCSSFSQAGVMELFRQRGTKEYAERINDRFASYNPKVAGILWERLLKCLSQDDHVMETLGFMNAKGLNPQLRTYRYGKGHMFAKHYDSSVVVPNEGTTRWTLLVYLTGGDQLVGGDTIFYSASNQKYPAVHPQVGMALLHKHGDDCLLHEAQEVYDGVKWVLRSDVVF